MDTRFDDRRKVCEKCGTAYYVDDNRSYCRRCGGLLYLREEPLPIQTNPHEGSCLINGTGIIIFVVVMLLLFAWFSTDLGYWFTCDFMGSFKPCPAQP